MTDCLEDISFGCTVKSYDLTRFHLEGTDDVLASAFPLLDVIPNWEALLRLSSDEDLKALR